MFSSTTPRGRPSLDSLDFWISTWRRPWWCFKGTTSSAAELGDFLLAHCNKKLAPSLPCNQTTRVFRYVNDSLFIFEWSTSSKPQKQAHWTLRLFESNLAGSTLTAEEPSDDNLRFLDLMLTVPPKRMRCKYSPCLSKNLLLLKSLIVKSPWRWLPIQLTGYRILPKSIRSASNDDLLN